MNSTVYGRCNYSYWGFINQHLVSWVINTFKYQFASATLYIDHQQGSGGPGVLSQLIGVNYCSYVSVNNPLNKWLISIVSLAIYRWDKPQIKDLITRVMLKVCLPVTIRGMILQLWPNKVPPVSSWSYSTIPNYHYRTR